MNPWARWTSSCADVQDELKALQKRLGITFIFVTHDRGEALSMADSLAVFNQGPHRPDRHSSKVTPIRKAASWPILSGRPTCCRPSLRSFWAGLRAGQACAPKPCNPIQRAGLTAS